MGLPADANPDQVTEVLAQINELLGKLIVADGSDGFLERITGIEREHRLVKFADLDPEDAGYFQQRFQDFDRRLSEAEKKWDADMKPFRGRKVVTYHNSAPNFAKHFGLDVVGFVEPRPGIPPTPSHTFELSNMMKRDHVKIIMVEPYFDRKTPDSIARQTDGVVVEYMPSVGGVKEITNYFQLFDYDIALLTKAFQSTQ